MIRGKAISFYKNGGLPIMLGTERVMRNRVSLYKEIIKTYIKITLRVLHSENAYLLIKLKEY